MSLGIYCILSKLCDRCCERTECMTEGDFGKHSLKAVFKDIIVKYLRQAVPREDFRHAAILTVSVILIPKIMLSTFSDGYLRMAIRK